MTATTPLSRRLAHPKQWGHGGRLLDLSPMAGMRHFPPPCWEGGHQPWKHPSSGMLRPWGPNLPPCVVARKGLCQTLQAPPNHPSHPRAPRLHPTTSTHVPSPAPSCPCGPQQPQGQALGKENSQNCNLPFSPQLRIPGPPLWGLVAAAQGIPTSWVTPRGEKCARAAFSHTPLHP